MLDVVRPVAIVYAPAIGLDELSFPVLFVLLPVSVVGRSVEVIEAADPFKVTTCEAALVGADTDEEHQTLAFKVPIYKASFVIVAVLEVEETIAPELVVLPLALISIATPVEHCAVALLKAKMEISFVAVPVARNENTLSVDLVSFPLAVVDRAVRKEHLAVA